MKDLATIAKEAEEWFKLARNKPDDSPLDSDTVYILHTDCKGRNKMIGDVVLASLAYMKLGQIYDASILTKKCGPRGQNHPRLEEAARDGIDALIQQYNTLLFDLGFRVDPEKETRFLIDDLEFIEWYGGIRPDFDQHKFVLQTLITIHNSAPKERINISDERPADNYIPVGRAVVECLEYMRKEFLSKDGVLDEVSFQGLRQNPNYGALVQSLYNVVVVRELSDSREFVSKIYGLTNIRPGFNGIPMEPREFADLVSRLKFPRTEITFPTSGRGSFRYWARNSPYIFRGALETLMGGMSYGRHTVEQVQTFYAFVRAAADTRVMNPDTLITEEMAGEMIKLALTQQTRPRTGVSTSDAYRDLSSLIERCPALRDVPWQEAIELGREQLRRQRENIDAKTLRDNPAATHQLADRERAYENFVQKLLKGHLNQAQYGHG